MEMPAMVRPYMEDAHPSPPKTAIEVQAQQQRKTNGRCASTLVRPHQQGPKEHWQLGRSNCGQTRVESADKPVPK